MASTAGSGKASKEHREHTFSAPDEEHVRVTPPTSRKEVVASWFKSIISCSFTSPGRRSVHKQPHCKPSSYQQEPSDHVTANSQLCAFNLHSTSQDSVAKLSIIGEPKAEPGNFHDSIDIERVLEKPSPSLKLYEAMPHENSIRLLRLHKGISTDLVEFTLEFARLDQTTPEYEALSYVWGLSCRDSYIVHRPSQKAISVTPNLREALENMRWCDRDRLIWVDALCINQGDGKEKGVQVCKMNAVYARASDVLVWLGPDAGGANIAFGALCALANEAFQQQSHQNITQTESAYYTTGPHEEPVVFDAVPHILEQDVWATVMRFFCSTWYTRLWVLQEIVLARNATFKWGSCSISWKYVGWAIEAICANPLLHMLLDTKNLKNACFMWYLSITHGNSRRPQSTNGSQTSHQDGGFLLLHLLDLARSFEATDSRDKIYGVLGFPTNNTGFNGDAVMPDYTLSTREVYAEVTRKFIETDQNLDVFGFVLRTPRDSLRKNDDLSNLPSWAPNFNSTDIVLPISNLNIGHQYSAGLSRPLCLLPSHSPNTLRLRGVILDTIRTTGPGIQQYPLNSMDSTDFTNMLKWSIATSTSLATIATTMTAGRSREGRLLSPAQKDQLVTDFAQLLQYFPFIKESAPPALAQPTPASKDGALAANAALCRAATYRRPFVTETGRFGLGPYASCEDADKLVVLWGAQCPFVAGQAEDGTWVLKGECFVEGCMDREAVEQLIAEQGREDVVFEFV